LRGADLDPVCRILQDKPVKSETVWYGVRWYFRVLVRSAKAFRKASDAVPVLRPSRSPFTTACADMPVVHPGLSTWMMSC